MKRAFAVALLFGLTTVAFAHDDDDDRRRRNDRGRNNGRWGGNDSRGGYGSNRGGYGSGNVVGRAIQNLRYAASRNRVDGHERDHFNKAVQHLQRFEYDAARGNYQSRELNNAIENMSHLADARQINPRDRQVIASDISALRSLGYGGYNRGSRW
jgi:hypothetical protein